MLDEFGSLGATLSRNEEARTRVCGSQAAAKFLSLIMLAATAAVREEAIASPAIGSSASLLAYLRLLHAHADTEVVRALYLDGRNTLLKDELVSTGTVSEAAFWPREIVRRCLELGASGVIMVHNHPSGDTTASHADQEVTLTLKRQCKIFGIELHDHLIVTRKGHASMRAQGII